MNMIEKCFLVQKMDRCRNTMLHQVISDCHPSTFSKNQQKGLAHNLLFPKSMLLNASMIEIQVFSDDVANPLQTQET